MPLDHPPSERHVQTDAQAAAVDAGEVAIGEPPYVVQTEDFQNVFDACTYFYIRLAAHQMAACRKLEEAFAAGGIVAVAQVAVHAPARKDFAPLQFLQQGNAVEEPSVQIVGDVPRGVLVVEELHRVHQAEGLGLYGVRQVGVGDDEQGEGHLVPYLSCFQNDVGVAEGREPETLLKTRFGVLVIVVAAQYAFGGHRVRQTEDGSVERDGEAVPLRLEELFARGIA